MNFSSPIKFSGISVISPNSMYLAVVQGVKVNVYAFYLKDQYSLI